MVWSDYQRHETKQPEKTLEFLERLEADLGVAHDNCRIFITGSGGSALAPLIGAKFVQEVTAVSLAVEKLHPEVQLGRSSSAARTRRSSSSRRIPRADARRRSRR